MPAVGARAGRVGDDDDERRGEEAARWKHCATLHLADGARSVHKRPTSVTQESRTSEDAAEVPCCGRGARSLPDAFRPPPLLPSWRCGGRRGDNIRFTHAAPRIVSRRVELHRKTGHAAPARPELPHYNNSCKRHGQDYGSRAAYAFIASQDLTSPHSHAEHSHTLGGSVMSESTISSTLASFCTTR